MLRTTLILGLSCLLFAAGADAQTPQQGRRLQDIVLDSGVTLADWVRVTRSREPTPSLATGAQAAQFVRQHGAHRELLDIVWRAAQHSDLERESITRENATERLVALTDARRQLGDWPSLLMASAAARAYLGDTAGATADLRRWMALAPVTDPSREHVAEVLLSTAQAPDAGVVWLTQSGISEIPIALRRPVDPFFGQFSKEMARARACLGPPAQFDDLRVLTEGKLEFNSRPFVSEVAWLTTELGLPLVESKTNGEEGASQAINVASGGTWGRSFHTLSSGERSELLTFSRNLKCTTALLPARKGKKVDASWDRELRSATGPEKSERTRVFRTRMQTEFLSDALGVEELARTYPMLKLRLPPDYRGRFYLVRMSFNSESVSPPSQAPITSGEYEGLFVEGPNAFVELAPHKFLAPGVTMTLSRP